MASSWVNSASPVLGPERLPKARLEVRGRMPPKGMLFVVSGPSGVGKGTLIQQVLAEVDDVRLSVSATTRPPRGGDRDGVDYFFVTHECFEQMREGGELLEWADVHGDLYGTPRGPVAGELGAGRDVVLEIDFQGALQVRDTHPDAVLIFVAPPLWSALEQRLIGRHTETPEELAKRLRAAERELQNMDKYDFLVVNDTVDRASDELKAIFIGERCRLARTDWEGLREQLLRDCMKRTEGERDLG